MNQYKNTELAGAYAGSRVTYAPWVDKIDQINNIVITEGISNI